MNKGSTAVAPAMNGARMQNIEIRQAGVYYEEHVPEKDEVCKNDDDLTLCLVKELL
jgi:hypothetical protein